MWGLAYVMYQVLVTEYACVKARNISACLSSFFSRRLRFLEDNIMNLPSEIISMYLFTIICLMSMQAMPWEIQRLTTLISSLLRITSYPSPLTLTTKMENLGNLLRYLLKKLTPEAFEQKGIHY